MIHIWHWLINNISVNSSSELTQAITSVLEPSLFICLLVADTASMSLKLRRLSTPNIGSGAETPSHKPLSRAVSASSGKPGSGLFVHTPDANETDEHKV